MSPYHCPCPNVVACNCLHGFENIADRVYWKLRLVQLALIDELLTINGEYLHFAAGGRLRLQHLLVLPDEYKLEQQASMEGHTSRYAIHPSVSGTPPSLWPYGGDSIPIVQANLGGATFLPALLDGRKGSADSRRIYAYHNCGQKNLGSLKPEPCVPIGPVTRSWTLPLSWVGQTHICAATITPTGVVAGTPQLHITGRNLTLDLTPGRPIRLIC